MNDNQLQQLLQAINTLQDLGKVAYFNKGAYNSETTYEINDVVTYQGSSYVSLGNNNQGNLPTNATYWSVVALKGDKGDTGKPFVIEKTYISIQEMVADYDNMNVNDYVMISGSIEDEQNATLWTKRETPTPTYKWVYLADFSGASGITGQTPNIQIGNVTEGNEPAVTRRQGSTNENPILDFVLKTGAKGDTGATGNGISQVSKTSTSGLTDTYTIEYTSGNSTTFDVTNGKGITSIAKTSTSGLVDTYTITYNDGTTSTFTVTNGEDSNVLDVQLNGTTIVDNNGVANITGVELQTNKVTSISSNSTDTQYPSAKCVYDSQASQDALIENLQTENEYLNSVIEQAFDEITDEDTEITLNNTIQAKMKMELKGNTEQTTYTGNNLINFPYYETTKTVNGITFTVKNDGTIHVQGTASAKAEFLLRNRDINLSITEGETYTLATSGLGAVDNTLWLDTYGQTGNFLDKWALSQTTTYTSAVAQSKDIKPLLKISVTNGATVNTDVKVWLYKGSYDETTTYEPYVGGTPSPNPDYPQDIRVVTGNNTIIVSNSDNTQSQTYPINLGTMELCKIDTYQDYIYKENNKWYKHSEIGKVVLDGSEENLSYNSTDNRLQMPFNLQTQDWGVLALTLCDHFTIGDTETVDGSFNITRTILFFKNNNLTSLNDWKTWLGSNNTTVYYVLATPTNTEITDTTLISQLNAIENAMSYKTQTNISQTNANLSFILYASALGKNQ